MREMDRNAFVRSSMKAHQGGGDIVRIESGATFHGTIHRHGAYPNPGPGEVLSQCEGPHPQRRLSGAETRQARARMQRGAAACEEERPGSRRAHGWRHECGELRRRENVDSHRALAGFTVPACAGGDRVINEA